MCTEYSTDQFFIFARKCKYTDENGKERNFFKIYKPQTTDKAYRFVYYPEGERPKNYINGYEELKKAYEVEQALNEEVDDTNDSKHTKKHFKLECAVICCGERDALCCRSMGYHPIWFNSETYTPTYNEMECIRELVEKIYYIPDLDETGVRRASAIALTHLDIKIVWLPDWLRKYKTVEATEEKILGIGWRYAPVIRNLRIFLKAAAWQGSGQWEIVRKKVINVRYHLFDYFISSVSMVSI